MQRIKKGNSNTLKHRRYLRCHMTSAEQTLWKILKGKKFRGYKFRRQHGVQNYIVDFFCPALKIVVEIDGETHCSETEIQKDQIREIQLQKLGLKIIRFSNNDVLSHLESVLLKLDSFLKESATTPRPLLTKEGMNQKIKLHASYKG